MLSVLRRNPGFFGCWISSPGGAQGRGPVHLLLISAAELGFAWEGEGWVRVSLPLLRMMTGPVQHFRSAILDAWRFHVFSRLSERKGFFGGEFADFQGSLQPLTSSHLWERDKMLLRALLCGECLERIPSWQGQEGRRSLSFCGERDGDGHLFWECTFPSSSSMLGIFLNLLIFCLWIVATGPVVCFGMVGYLVLVALVTKDPWATSFGDLASSHLERCLGAYPVDFASCWTPPEYWDAADIALEMFEYPNIRTDGSREDFSSVGGFEVAGAGVYLPASDVAFESAVLKSMVMLDWSVAVLLCLFPGLCRLFSVLNSGVLFLPCRRTGLVI